MSTNAKQVNTRNWTVVSLDFINMSNKMMGLGGKLLFLKDSSCSQTSVCYSNKSPWTNQWKDTQQVLND